MNNSIAKIESAKKRALRRSEKRAENAALSGKSARKRVKRKKLPSMKKVKATLWQETSLTVRSWSPVCMACNSNPTECAAHIVPSNDAAITRYFLPNLYPCCFSCNEAERHYRGQWVKRHEEMFGSDVVDALYAMSRNLFQPKRWWYVEQTERIKKLRGPIVS